MESTFAFFEERPRPVQGVSLGIVMLDTRFRRFPGDIGFAASFPFPVQYAIARGFSDGAKIQANEETLAIFTSAILDLADMGVDGIGTSCGFLSLMQAQLQERSPVPVATSSLLQVPMLQKMLPRGKTIGVLAANKNALTPGHLEGAGITQPVAIGGMPLNGMFLYNMLSGNMKIDQAAQEREVLLAVEQLLIEDPSIGALVLECTNLAPYSRAIRDRFGLPVYDVMTMLRWFHAGLLPQRY